MHKLSPGSAHSRSPLARRLPQRPRSRMRQQWRIALAALAAAGVIVLLAWIDGGEEPLHAISQPVPLPQDAQDARAARAAS